MVKYLTQTATPRLPGLPSARSAPRKNVFQSWHLVVFFPIAARAEDSTKNSKRRFIYYPIVNESKKKEKGATGTITISINNLHPNTVKENAR